MASCAVEVPHLIIYSSDIMAFGAAALSFFHGERIGGLMATFAATVRCRMLNVHRIVHDTLQSAKPKWSNLINAKLR